MPSPLPILVPILGLSLSVAVLLVGDRRAALGAATVGGELLVLGVAALLLAETADGSVLVHQLGGWGAPVGIAFVADRLAALFLAVTTLVCAAALLYAFLDEEPANRSRVVSLIFLLQTGISGSLLTGDLFDLYVFFELMGLASYGLVGYRAGAAHVEAGLKYAALSLVGSTFMLMGAGAVYAQTGTLTLAALRDASLELASPELYLFSTALVLTSFALKAALVPLHFWLPDAHSIAPTAVSVMLSGAVVKVGAYGILRVLGANAPWVWEACGAVLLPVAALTAVVCALMAVTQRDLKRLLAYSTASQMGYVLAAGALGSVEGVAGSVVHVAAHAAMKSTLFLMAGTAMAATGERRWDRMGGLLGRSPVLAAAALVAALSLAGIPPLAGFAGKLTIFEALLRASAYATLAALLAASLVMIVAMARIWLAIFGGAAAAGAQAPRLGKVALTAGMAAVVVGVGLAAGPLVADARGAAAQLLEGGAYRAAVIGNAARAERP